MNKNILDYYRRMIFEAVIENPKANQEPPEEPMDPNFRREEDPDEPLPELAPDQGQGAIYTDWGQLTDDPDIQDILESWEHTVYFDPAFEMGSDSTAMAALAGIVKWLKNAVKKGRQVTIDKTPDPEYPGFGTITVNDYPTYVLDTKTGNVLYTHINVTYTYGYSITKGKHFLYRPDKYRIELYQYDPRWVFMFGRSGRIGRLGDNTYMVEWYRTNRWGERVPGGWDDIDVFDPIANPPIKIGDILYHPDYNPNSRGNPGQLAHKYRPPTTAPHDPTGGYGPWQPDPQNPGIWKACNNIGECIYRRNNPYGGEGQAPNYNFK